jgi:pyrophosphatase PpaX
MRHRVVLFDLDGTLIDSAAIILASMRHATRTVLDREIEDEILMAAVGGAGLSDQMRLIDPHRVDELVRVYRQHNEPLHSTLEACSGILEVVPRLREEGRQLGIVTAKRRATVQLAFDVLPELEPLFDVVVGSEDTERHKPEPEPLLHALKLLGAGPREAAYVGDSPFDVRAAKAGGLHAVAVTWGGIHPEERLLAEDPDAVVRSAEELHDVL